MSKEGQKQLIDNILEDVSKLSESLMAIIQKAVRPPENLDDTLYSYNEINIYIKSYNLGYDQIIKAYLDILIVFKRLTIEFEDSDQKNLYENTISELNKKLNSLKTPLDLYKIFEKVDLALTKSLSEWFSIIEELQTFLQEPGDVEWPIITDLKQVDSEKNPPKDFDSVVTGETQD